MIIDDDPIIVKIFYLKTGRNYSVFSEEDFLKQKELKDFKSEEYKCATIKMKPMTWGLYNDLQEKSSIVDETGKNKFNFKLYKEQRLKNLIIEWDVLVKNDKGEMVPLPVNEANIMKLSPEVAETILMAYETVSYVSGEDEKK